MFKYLATAAAVKFLVCRPGTEVPIHESLSTTSRSLGYELILAMCFYINVYRTVIDTVPPPELVAVDNVPKYKGVLIEGLLPCNPNVISVIPSASSKSWGIIAWISSRDRVDIVLLLLRVRSEVKKNASPVVMTTPQGMVQTFCAWDGKNRLKRTCKLHSRNGSMVGPQSRPS